MKKKIVFALCILALTSSLAQERGEGSNSNLNTSRQGFGEQSFFDMGLGFVNPKAKTEGSAYYFDNWETEGIIYTSKKQRFKIKNININLFYNTLDALYDGNSVYTFNNENLVKIVINGKDFRVFKVENEVKILESFFRGTFSVYRYNSVLYRDSSPNPMINRKTNKYVKKSRFYVYKKGNLERLKLSKKSFAKIFQSDTKSKEDILDFIKENKISLSDEEGLLKALNFAGK